MSFFQEFLNGNYTWYFAVVITLIVSITIHELAHGFAALRFGDSTPIDTGHMTGNPLVHMGPMSLACVFLVGFGWGAMPVDPTRMRGRHAHTLVALAGPASNLVLCVLALVVLGLMMRFNLLPDGDLGKNVFVLLYTFGSFNLLLAVFNLIPIPPMDGSRVLAEYSQGFRDLIDRPEAMGAANAAFIVLFMFGGKILWPMTYAASDAVLTVVAG